MTNIFSGARLFELKATHGIPLDVAIQEIIDSNVRISWGEFVDQARANKWWDFQIVELIEQALGSTIVDREYCKGVLCRLKIYMLENAHPYTKEVE